MKLSIVVISPDLRLIDLVRDRRAGLVPDHVREGLEALNFTLAVADFYVGPAALKGFCNFTSDIAASSEAVLLLFDRTGAAGAQSFSDAFFVAGFDSRDMRSNAQNFITPVLARALKNLRVYAQRFLEQKYRNVLLLPLLNFNAAELREMQALFNAGTLGAQFVETLDRNLGLLRDRRTPKKSKHYEDIYIRDDREHYYIYGYERHRWCETDSPPHAETCKPNSLFRFGLRYDDRRHFNVSLEAGNIEGDFVGCHGSKVEVASTSHINMFPNSYL
jgi:hypothetical protein